MHVEERKRTQDQMPVELAMIQQFRNIPDRRFHIPRSIGLFLANGTKIVQGQKRAHPFHLTDCREVGMVGKTPRNNLNQLLLCAVVGRIDKTNLAAKQLYFIEVVVVGENFRRRWCGRALGLGEEFLEAFNSFC